MGNKNFKYNTYILLSAVDIIAGILSLIGIAYFSVAKHSKGFVTSSGAATSHDLSALYIGVCFAIFIICAISYLFLTEKRQEYRDLVDFDENGNSRKYNDFKKLSGKERDEINRQKMMDAERVLSSSTLMKITHKGVKDPDKELDALIGLTEVKSTMKELVAKIQFEKQKWKDDGGKGRFISQEPMNMIFLGPAGTGKTTVARIMAGFLFQNGYIQKNQCIEVDGNFLKGMYVGESAKKTSLLIQKSLGGVLFIDEAYALLTGSGGDEAIATLVKEMEDHRHDLVVILAGYDKEMNAFVNSNPGIASRIKYFVHFGNYSMKDYQQMFLKLAHDDNYKVSEDYLKEFIKLMKNEMLNSNFGNARTVRNIFEKTISRHASNIANRTLSEDKRYCICSVDIPEKSYK